MLEAGEVIVLGSTARVGGCTWTPEEEEGVDATGFSLLGPRVKVNVQ